MTWPRDADTAPPVNLPAYIFYDQGYVLDRIVDGYMILRWHGEWDQ